jgi:hypothetical protein
MFQLPRRENSPFVEISIRLPRTAVARLLLTRASSRRSLAHFALSFCTGINKSQTADMYAPSTVNGDTMTGELSSMSDEKSDVNFDANDYVVSAISQYVLSNK